MIRKERGVHVKILVRRAIQSDTRDIYDITQEAFTKYAEDLGNNKKIAALNETIESIEQDLYKKHVFIGFLDGVPIGSIRFEIFPGNIAYISRFGVKLDGQRCGMGHALMETVETECIKMGAYSITLHTASKMTSLMRFYYGLGYFVHSTSTTRGYIRAFLYKELVQTDQVELGAVMQL